MVQKQKGYPDEGALVIVTVTKIQYHSVFCRLDEYDKSGMIHISEIAPGRIKNIQDYVQEGKTIICKVLRVSPEKGHIDLSIRRVTEAQRRQKAAALKQQQLSEKIIELLAAELKQKKQDLVTQLEQILVPANPTLYTAFQAVVEQNVSLTDMGVDKQIAEPLEKIIRERIKPQEVTIRGYLRIHSFLPDGVEQIKKAFDASSTTASISYGGGGRYDVQVTAKDYKAAEEQLKQLRSGVESVLASDSFVQFERTDK